LQITFALRLSGIGATKMLIEVVRGVSARRGIGCEVVAGALALARARESKTVKLLSRRTGTTRTGSMNGSGSSLLM
jgi:hypothetical protein